MRVHRLQNLYHHVVSFVKKIYAPLMEGAICTWAIYCKKKAN